MSTEYEIKTYNEIGEYLDAYSKNGFAEEPYQLQTNSAMVYHLQNGEVVFEVLSNQRPGIVFRNKQAFKKCVAEDRFPITNGDDYLDTEVDRTAHSPGDRLLSKSPEHRPQI